MTRVFNIFNRFTLNLVRDIITYSQSGIGVFVSTLNQFSLVFISGEKAEVSSKRSSCEEVQLERNKTTSEIYQNNKDNFFESSGTIVNQVTKYISLSIGSIPNFR